MAEQELLDSLEDDLLDNLLSAANEGITTKSVKEIDLFGQEDSEPTVEKPQETSKVKYYDSDSSDDEANRCFENAKYNSSGKEINQLLKGNDSEDRNTSVISNGSSSWKKLAPITTAPKLQSSVAKSDIYTDPVFGLRIVNPVVSSHILKEKMQGREAVPLNRISRFLQMHTKNDWVIAGVIANKSPVKTSQKGNQFSIWTLTDLKTEIKTVSVFLFSNSHKEFWKTTIGTVVGILNPNVMDRKDNSKDEACLSVINPQKIMILGESKDLGTCKSTKKNGEKCTAIVNKSICEFCIYHIKSEYQKCSLRSELQSNFVGQGLRALQNKLLGKNEVFYAGKSYSAIPAKKSKKLEKKDSDRLQSLHGINTLSQNIVKAKSGTKKAATNLDISQTQRLKDLALLEKLGGKPFEAISESKKLSLDVISRLKNAGQENKEKTDIVNPNTQPKPLSPQIIKTSDNIAMGFPMLSGYEGASIDLNKPILPKHKQKAKENAIKFVQRFGPIKKVDPNSPKSQKRKAETPKSEIINLPQCEKKIKIQDHPDISDRFKKMMAQTSKHVDLLEQLDDEEQEKYFNKLERKEQMEEKMINTFKVPCKAVTCTECKYTNFSASEKCKTERHVLKVTDAMKRFFKCGNCGNRTVTLKIVPTTACTNCGSGKWEKTGMMKEKVIGQTHSLSIRGGEQKFTNSVIQDINISLLVPDV